MSSSSTVTSFGVTFTFFSSYNVVNGSQWYRRISTSYSGLDTNLGITPPVVVRYFPGGASLPASTPYASSAAVDAGETANVNAFLTSIRKPWERVFQAAYIDYYSTSLIRFETDPDPSVDTGSFTTTPFTPNGYKWTYVAETPPDYGTDPYDGPGTPPSVDPDTIPEAVPYPDPDDPIPPTTFTPPDPFGVLVLELDCCSAFNRRLAEASTVAVYLRDTETGLYGRIADSDVTIDVEANTISFTVYDINDAYYVEFTNVTTCVSAPTLNRIRSNISKQTTITDYGVRPVDGTFNEVFMPFVDLDLTTKLDFIEIMRWPDASLTRWPVPQNTASFESSYIGESQLARIATFDAPRVIEAVERMTYPSVVANRTLNADGNYECPSRYVIDYFFSLCDELYPWFSAETCPAIYAADGLEVPIDALFIPQSENNKVTIDEFLKEILSCTGIEIIENKAGNLELVPRYGPDAYSDATIVLKESDIAAPLYEPKADPRDFYNAAEITQRPLTFEVGQEVLTPTYAVWAYSDDHDAEFTLPSGFTAINGADNVDKGIFHAGIGWFYENREYSIPILDADTLIGGDLIWLDVQVNTYKNYFLGFSSNGSTSTEYQTITLTADATAGDSSLTASAISYALPNARTIEFNQGVAFANGGEPAGETSIAVYGLIVDLASGSVGVTSQVSVATSGGGGTTYLVVSDFDGQSGDLELNFRFDPATQSLIVKPTDIKLLSGIYEFYFELEIRGYGAKYVQSAISTTASFGLNDTDELATADGPEGALAASRALYGRKTLRVSLNYISMSLARLTAIAEALVRQYINPAKLWEFSLSPIGMQRGPDFDSIGQKIRLPNNKELVVEGITYSDAKTYQSLAVSMTVKARETFIIYDEESLDFGYGYYVDEAGNYYVDENGDYYIDETYIAADGDPAPLPSPADPVAASFEGYGGEDNDGDWTNASVTTVSTYADVKTQLAIAGTQATPRIVRLTANCTGSGAGGFGTDDLVMAAYVGLDLNGFSLLGGSAEPEDSDNVVSANWYPDGVLMDNHCRVFSSQSGGKLGHFYDGVRMRNNKTGMIIENVDFLFCMDETIDYFAGTAGTPTTKASILNCTFRAHSTAPADNDSHPILVQSDNFTHANTYLTIARCRFNANLANRVPFMKNGGFLHMYNCVQYNMLSADGHVNLSGGAKGLFENNVIYDSSTSGGQRFTFTNNTATAQFSGNFYMNNATQGLPNGTAFTPSYSYTLIADRIDIAAESGAH